MHNRAIVVGNSFSDTRALRVKVGDRGGDDITPQYLDVVGTVGPGLLVVQAQGMAYLMDHRAQLWRQDRVKGNQHAA